MDFGLRIADLKTWLRDLRFFESIGVERLTVMENQRPIIEIFQRPEEIIFGFHLTDSRKEDFINNENMEGRELKEIDPKKIAVYKTDGVIDFMGNPRGKLPDGRHLFRLYNLRLCLFQPC